MDRWWLPFWGCCCKRTEVINGDEEISSPGSRKLIAKEGAAHDAVLSFEGSRVDQDKLSLATSGIAMATMTVKGKSSHAGGAPERGDRKSVV